MEFMRDSNGVPHPTTCGIFGASKKCTCRSAAQYTSDEAMIEAVADVAKEIEKSEQ